MNTQQTLEAIRKKLNELQDLFSELEGQIEPRLGSYKELGIDVPKEIARGYDKAKKGQSGKPPKPQAGT